MIPDAAGWLRYELKFDETDLSDNRAGRLSEAQLNMLKEKFADRLAGAMIGQFLIIAFSGIIVTALIYFQSRTDENCVTLFIVLLTWYVLHIARIWISGKLDLLQRSPATTIGQVGDPPPNLQDILHSRLFLRSTKPSLQLMVPAMYFEKGQHYRMYYLRRTKLLLSAEPVDFAVNDQEASD